jgi:hypothetical protein
VVLKADACLKASRPSSYARVSLKCQCECGLAGSNNLAWLRLPELYGHCPVCQQHICCSTSRLWHPCAPRCVVHPVHLDLVMWQCHDVMIILLAAAAAFAG